MKHSNGTFITNEFDLKYVGAWKDDTEHGEGKFYDRNKGLSYSNYCSKFTGCFIDLYDATAKKYIHWLKDTGFECVRNFTKDLTGLFKDHLTSCLLWKKIGRKCFKRSFRPAGNGVRFIWQCVTNDICKAYKGYNKKLGRYCDRRCWLCPCAWGPLYILGLIFVGPIWILTLISMIFPLIYGLIAIVLFIPYFFIAYIMFTLFCILAIMFTYIAIGFYAIGFAFLPLLFIFLFLGICGIFIGFSMVLPGPIFGCIKVCKCNEWKLVLDGRWRYGERL